MKSVNKVFLLGHLTRDPELKRSEGKSLSVSLGWQRTGTGQPRPEEKREETEFHRIIAWDKLAETCHQYLRKGRKIYAEGRLQNRSYTGQDSVEKYSIEIVLEKMEMLDSMRQDVKETLNGAAVQQVQ